MELKVSEVISKNDRLKIVEQSPKMSVKGSMKISRFSSFVRLRWRLKSSKMVSSSYSGNFSFAASLLKTSGSFKTHLVQNSMDSKLLKIKFWIVLYYGK